MNGEKGTTPRSGRSYGVLIVEDETIASRAHASFVERVGGFHVVWQAKNAAQALAVLSGKIPAVDPRSIDLILLDMNLGESHGLRLLQTLRARNAPIDVIAVTASRDIRVVKQALAMGTLQYLVKPFTFDAFKEKLESYLAYRASLESQGGVVSQEEIDSIFSANGSKRPRAIAKNVPRQVQEDLLEQLSDGHAISAAEASELLGVSRVTARRYLEAMADLGTLVRKPRYGTTGRPVLEYVSTESQQSG